MARNFTGRGAWWQVRSRVEDPLFSAHQVSSKSQHNPSSTEKCDIMMVLKGVVFLHITCIAVTVT